MAVAGPLGGGLAPLALLDPPPQWRSYTGSKGTMPLPLSFCLGPDHALPLVFCEHTDVY